MSGVPIWCQTPTCKRVTPHVSDEESVTCTVCGLSRPVTEPMLIVAAAISGAPVVEVRFCPWCRATLPVGHDCPAGAVGCSTNPPEGPACGTCSGCQQTQLDDYQRRQNIGGSPSDLDAPGGPDG